jgi:hypothetical protein
MHVSRRVEFIEVKRETRATKVVGRMRLEIRFGARIL